MSIIPLWQQSLFQRRAHTCRRGVILIPFFLPPLGPLQVLVYFAGEKAEVDEGECWVASPHFSQICRPLEMGYFLNISLLMVTLAVGTNIAPEMVWCQTLTRGNFRRAEDFCLIRKGMTVLCFLGRRHCKLMLKPRVRVVVHLAHWLLGCNWTFRMYGIHVPWCWERPTLTPPPPPPLCFSTLLVFLPLLEWNTETALFFFPPFPLICWAGKPHIWLKGLHWRNWLSCKLELNAPGVIKLVRTFGGEARQPATVFFIVF